MGFQRLKLLINLGFILLVSWWLVLNLHNIKNSIGNIYFSLGVALYALGIGLMFSYELVTSKINKNRFFSLFVCLGTILYGLGNVVWFYFDYSGQGMVPFPSLADIFYVLQFPLIIGAVFMLEKDLFFKDFMFYMLGVVAVILVLSIGLTLYLGNPGFSLDLFLVLYFPIQSFSVAFLLVYKIVRQEFALRIGLIVFMLAQITWLSGDIFFFYELLNFKFYVASFADFLYLLAIFMNYFAILKLTDNSDTGGVFSEDGLSLLKHVTYLIPTSLNSLNMK